MQDTQLDPEQQFDPHQKTATSIRDYYSELYAQACPVVRRAASTASPRTPRSARRPPTGRPSPPTPGSACRDSRWRCPPSLIPGAAEEALRLDTPLHGFYRQTTTDVTVQGCPIPPGSNVLLNYGAANRDPQVFDRAEEFVLDRADNEHLAFGYGIHSCVGARLARLEMRVVTEQLLRRLPDLAATIDAPGLRWGAGNISVIDQVPVRFTPASALTDLVVGS